MTFSRTATATATAATAACLLGACGATTPPVPTGAPELVSFSVADAPVENGKKLNASFRELRREPDHSVVRAAVVSGGSVSSSMFILRGACLVLHARGARYVTVAPEPGASSDTFRLTFPAQAAPEPGGPGKGAFSAGDCRLLGFE